jgi:hypothetical protein
VFRSTGDAEAWLVAQEEDPEGRHRPGEP